MATVTKSLELFKAGFEKNRLEQWPESNDLAISPADSLKLGTRGTVISFAC